MDMNNFVYGDVIKFADSLFDEKAFKAMKYIYSDIESRFMDFKLILLGWVFKIFRRWSEW